jgi:hypothetical protein
VFKLRFVRDWGTFRIGDVKETPSPDTARTLVRIYKRAELLPGSDPLPAESDDAFNKLMEMSQGPSVLLGSDGKPLR